MLKLAKRGAPAETDTALTSGEYSRQFTSHFARNGVIDYSIAGSFNGATVSLEVSYDGGANFVAYAAKDAAGTVTNVTYAAACNDCIYGPGQRFRFACAGGSSPNVNIQVSGDVSLLPNV